MNIQALTELADFLNSGKADGHFDMADFFYKEGDEGIGGEFTSLPAFADFLNLTEDEYVVDGILHTCGTHACIGGWAVALSGDKSKRLAKHVARDALGLNVEQATELFTPYGRHLYVKNAREAAKVIYHLIDTGEVNWSIIDEPEVNE